MISERLVFLSIFVGIISGSGAFIFYILTHLLTELLLGGLSGFQPPRAGGETGLELNMPTSHIPLWLIPAIGGLISGLIVYNFAPEAEGEGTDAVIKAFHRFRGFIKAKIPIVKMLASAITIGSGGSAGREGPIAQIGGGFGSQIATLLKLSDSERRMLLIAGVAGGMGSIFRSPLGGAIYAVEVLYKKDYEVEAIIPAFISSITAYIIFVSLIGSTEHLFITPEVKIYNLFEIPLYLILGILSAIVATIYIRIFYAIHNIFKKLKITNYLKPAIGGLITGLIGMFIPQALGMGYGYVQEVIDGKIMLDVLILAIFGKILATAFTVGSGGSGGVFGPTVVIGSFIGGTIGYIFHKLFPDIVVQPTGYVLVGIASMIAGACKTPISAILMTVEMTGSYELLPVLMLSATTSYILTRDESLFIEQVSTRAESPAHRGEFLVDILESIKVEQVMTRNVITVSPKDSTVKVMELIKKTGYMGYPVIENGKLVGIITFNDVERVGIGEKIKVSDAMTRNVIVAYPDENLRIVLEKMVKYKIGRLPVVSRDDKTKLLGIISKRDIIREYVKIKTLKHH
ncbi:MAG TPA: CBS domain-containing protein [Archaeoglobus profundus]|nr:CBS domain-containing protein [Archaeoglobus profundus]